MMKSKILEKTSGSNEYIDISFQSYDLINFSISLSNDLVNQDKQP